MNNPAAARAGRPRLEVVAGEAAALDGEWASDHWEARRLGIPARRGRATARFDGISQPWLRDPVKRWSRLRLATGCAFTTIGSGALALTRFSGFLAACHPEAVRPGAITRPVLEDYLTWLVAQGYSAATRAGADASDQLKYLAERIPATFIYAGVDVEGSGLLAGTRGRQIAGRFGVITCQAFAYGTTAQRQEWQALIATLEQSLRLHRHAPGQLLKLAGYLHERTDGMIGSLSHLIRGAAGDAILDDTEKITRETLDRVGLDQAAEATRTRRKNARNRHDPSG